MLVLNFVKDIAKKINKFQTICPTTRRNLGRKTCKTYILFYKVMVIMNGVRKDETYKTCKRIN